MNLVNYLKDIYGYDTPIFLKDVRIGGKSKTAIKEAFSRMVKKGELKRKGNGIYYIESDKEFGSGIGFNQILDKKFLYYKSFMGEYSEIFVSGYYSGMTFLNEIGISDQVPMIKEITTSRTSSKKRIFKCGNSVAIIRKGKTDITFLNYKILQFLDMFHFVSVDEVKKNKKILVDYIIKNEFTKQGLKNYLKFYSDDTIKKIVEGGLYGAFIEW